MNQWIPILFLLFIAMAVVTVVGHGIWMLLAAIFGSQAGDREESPAGSTFFCHQCRHRIVGRPARCPSCGCLLRNEGTATETAELAATKRQLDRMLRGGAIDRPEWLRLTSLIRVEQERLHAGVSRRPFAAQPRPAESQEAIAAAEEPAELVDFVDDQPAAAAVPSVTPVSPAGVPAKQPRAATPAPAPRPQPATSRPPERKQPLTGLLQAFMEDRNIRWGELISGMLIVISAVGLVISLWSTLSDTIPYFPALLFMLLTAAIHGAGLYTLKRWKLKSTSRGLIVISTLLVPLNFLAAIALSEGNAGTRDVADPWYVVAVVVGLLGFGLITLSAARTLTRLNRWPLFVAVMGASASQLVLTRWTAPGLSAGMLNLLAALPLTAYLAGTIRQLQIAALGRRLSALRARQTFLMFGLALFAVAAPLGLMIWKTHNVRGTLAALSPALSLLAMTILALGLLVHRRLTQPGLASTRMAGTWLALVGMSGLLAGLAFAWPRPDLLIAVGLIDFAALTALAVIADLSVLHIGATAALAFVAIVGLNLSQGTIAISPSPNGRRMLEVLLMGRSGSVLAGLSLLTAAITFVLHRRENRATSVVVASSRQVFSESSIHAFGYLLSTAGLAATATLIACYAGFITRVDGWQATPVLALYTVCTLAVVPLVRRAWVSWLAAGLLQLALLHAFLRNPQLLELLHFHPQDPFVLAVLLHGSVLLLLAFWFRQRFGDEVVRPEVSIRSEDNWLQSLSISALLSSAVTVIAVLHVDGMRFGAHAGYALWLGVLWGCVAWLHQMRPLWIAAQSLSTFAVGYAVTAICRQQEWWADRYYDPRHLQSQLCALGCYSIAWWFARQQTVRFLTWQALMSPPELLANRDSSAITPAMEPLFRTNKGGFTFDRVLLGGVLFGVVALSMCGAFPGIHGEFLTAAAASGTNGSPNHLSSAGLLVLFIVGLLCLVLFVAGAIQLASRPVPAFVLTMLALTWGLVSIAGVSRLGVFAKSLAENHALTHGWGTWIALAIVAAGLALSLREDVSPAALCGALMAAFAVPLLIAGRFEADLATASALRWCLTAVATLAAAGLLFRSRLAEIFGNPAALPPTRVEISSDTVRPLAIGIPAIPILIITLRYVLTIIDGAPPAAPLAGTFFANIGPVWSYAAPVAVLAILLSLYAYRDRLPIYALGGSLALQLAVCLLFAVPRWSAGAAMTFPDLAQLLQWCGLALGVYSLGWLFVERQSQEVSQQLQAHLAINATVVLVPLAWAALAIFVFPSRLPASVAALGSPTGFLALLCTTAALVLHNRKQNPRTALHALFAAAAGVVVLMAAALADRNSSGNWLSYHVLGAGWCVLAATASTAACYVMYLGGRLMQMPSDHYESIRDEDSSLPIPLLHDTALLVPPLSRWAMALGAVVSMLALRGLLFDPERPWWSAGMTGVIACSTAALALRGKRQSFAYLSVGYLLTSVTFIWLRPWLGIGVAAGAQAMVHLIEANLIALAVCGLAWLAVEVYWQRRGGTFASVPRAAALVGLVATAGLVAVCLVIQTASIDMGRELTVNVSNPGGWGMLAALALLIAASFWDRRASHALRGLYAVGLLGLLMAINSLQPTPRMLMFQIGLAGAGYALLTALIARFDRQFVAWGTRLNVPREHLQWEEPRIWLTGTTWLLAMVTVLAAFRIVLTFPELHLRLWATGATALLPLAVAARIRPGEGTSDIHAAGALFGYNGARRHLEPTPLRFIVLALAVIAAVDLGWAIMPYSNDPHFWLSRSIRLMEVLGAATFVYTVIVHRLLPEGSGTKTSEWFRSMRLAASLMGAAAIISLLAVLVLEGVWFDPQTGPPIDGVQIAIVATVLVGLAAALISLAVLPGRDPLELSERGRMLYVYAAELVLSLLFLHIRFTMPELFRGLLLPYWPLIAMAIAYAGIGAGELFRRLRLMVLAEPLERTGIFLPLLPAIGFWIHVSLAGPGIIQPEYSTVLFFAGLMYVLLCVWRKSFVFGAAAAVAGNAALWALLHEQGLELLTHPQMWMIPPAVSVLLAAQLNRRRLSEPQLAGIRYMAVMVIYVSSTADMFITGVGESLWLPMVLAALSVAGVFAGILLRVRAFLYLGTTFLFLSLVSMVWHAAQSIGRVWPWWAFGMLLGIAILALFGVFEKKRNEVLGALRQLREWE